MLPQIHMNPCFFKSVDSTSSTVLPKVSVLFFEIVDNS